MKILFWTLIGIEAVAYLGFLVFAVAFALGSKSNPLSILGLAVGLLLVGLLVFGLPTLLFVRSASNLGRIAALMMVMVPVLLVGVSAVFKALEVDDRDHFDTTGRMIHFGAGRPRELEAAIVAGDVAKVMTLAQRVKLNQPGHKDATYMMVSAREIWRSTNQLEILTVLLDHGADFRLRDRDGHDALWYAVSARHWPAVLLLLRRGADWTAFRTPEGQGIREQLDAEAARWGNGRGLAEVIAFIQTGPTIGR